MNKNIKITKTEGIKEVSYLEEFNFEYKNENFNIKYFHPECNFSEEEITKRLYYTWFIEFIDKMQILIPDNSEVLDIGAFDGDTALPLGLMAGKNGRCIAFECGPAWHRLQINTALNQSLNIENYYYAIFDRDGVTTFNYSNDVGGPTHKTAKIGDYPLKRLVRTVNTVKFLDKLNINNLSLIKVDTEGFDVQILNLLDKYINKFRPVIHIEWFPTTENELHQFLINKNYSSVDFETNKLFDILPDYWTQDLILIPKEKIKNFNTFYK